MGFRCFWHFSVDLGFAGLAGLVCFKVGLMFCFLFDVVLCFDCLWLIYI